MNHATKVRRLESVVVYALAALLVLTASAEAHIQILRGRLIEAVRHGSLIVIGRIEQVTPRDGRTVNVTIRVEKALHGTPPADTLEFSAPIGFGVGQRHVLFLEAASGRWVSVAPSGALFPAVPTDDSAYQQAIAHIRTALESEATGGLSTLRAALISALSAPAPALRYYAAIELTTLGRGACLDAQDRAALQRIIDDPSADPTLRPLLSALLRRNLP